MDFKRIEIALGVKCEDVTVTKNNGIKFHGVRLVHPTINISPVLYRKPNMSDEEFEDYIINMYNKALDNYEGCDIEMFKDKERIFENVLPALVNTEMNKEMLKSHWIHKKFRDLSIIYKVKVPAGLVTMTYDLADILDISLDELHDAAVANLEPWIVDMADLDNRSGISLKRGMMYVLSNDDKMYGAGCITSNAILRRIYDRIGTFYVIPASVHEVICVPNVDNVMVSGLANLIHEANKSEVDCVDILSDTLYKYNGKILSIVNVVC